MINGRKLRRLICKHTIKIGQTWFIKYNSELIMVEIKLGTTSPKVPYWAVSEVEKEAWTICVEGTTNMSDYRMYRQISQEKNPEYWL